MTSSPPQKIPETNPTASEKVSAACLIESEVNFPTKNSRVSDLVENSLWQPSGASTPVSDAKDDASSPVTACHVGHRVCVGGTKVGILRYFGDIEFTTGLFCGVELDEPVGLNDGSVQGVRYFTCRPNYGIIAPVRIVKPLPGGSWQSRRKHSPDGTCRTRRRSATFSLDVSGPFNPLDGLVSPDDSLMVHKEDNDATTSTRDVPLSNAQSQQQSSGSTPTPSNATSNQVLWKCWNQQQPCSSSLTSPRQHQQNSFEQNENLGITSPDRLESSPYRSSLTSYRQQHQENSFEQDESLGILTPDQPESPKFSSSSTPSQLQHHQNSFEQDESLGILTPDQLEPTQFLSSSVPWQINQQFLSSSLPWQLSQTQPLQLSKQSSFEQDESLGILTPDQMTDFTVCAESSSVGRISSFEDKGTFLLGDFRSELVDDLLPDRMPSESDGPSSSTYPSSEFPQFPADTPDLVFNPQGETINPNEFSVTMVEGVTMRELELHNHDAPSNQQHCASNKVLDLTMCEDLSDNVCPVITSKSSTPASMRVGQDISDRTLSPEDLPMDAPFQGVIGEILQKSEVTTSESGRDNSGISGATSAGPSSRSSAAPPPPSSFVTSVTSITSLDNGYQGDGEWSRPASRGADHSPTSNRVIKLKTADPMTDSDFFTESDADMHDEMTAASGRGDRRAQVIDGTLYGTNLHSVLLGQQHQRCPSFTASINEEMESSGVYSDLERRPEDPGSDGKEFQSEERAPVGGDFSPDGSIKTVSSRSEQSQVKETPPGFTTIISQTTPDIVGNIATAMDTTEAVNDLLIENNVKNSQMATVGEADSIDRSLLKVERMPSSGNIKSANSPAGSILNTSIGSKSSKEESQHQLKKYKMPKRNVVSKIKAMIESSAPSSGATRSGAGSASTEDENQENRRPTRSPSKSLRKNAGRWDAVMNKIAQGQAEQKLKPRSLKEVKSKVFANILPAPPPQTDGLASRNRKTSTSDKTSSSRALKENSPLKAKSRRARTRTSTTSLAQQQQTSGNPTIAGRVSSPNSSPHSSISDVSVNQNHSLGKASTKSVSSLRSSKKREVGRSTSPLSDGSTNSTASHVMTRSSSNHLTPLSHHTNISSARERVLRDNVNRNSPVNLQKQRQPRNPRVLLSNMVNKHSNGRRTSAPIQEKNGVSVTAAVDMKTPPVRKQASRRNTPSNVQKPTPLRDHNRQQQAGGGGVFKTGEALPSNKPGELAVPPQQPPPATQPQPTPAELLLPQLRHNSAGFEALGVLVQYLVFNLDAFSTPQLQKDLQRMKTEWLKTKLELEEAQVSYRRIEDNLVQEKALHSQKIEELETARHCQLSARDAQHSREIAELVARHEAQLTDFEKRLQEQLEEMKGRYEMELFRAEEQHAHKLESVIVDGKASLEQLKHDHEAAVAHLQVDAAQREAELRRKLTSIEEEYSGLKDQSRKLMDSMQKDKDTKLQATAGRCKELQDEVESLRTVLDLRHEELQELRKQNALLTREAEELPLALQRVAALDAKVEDLQVQLEMKTSLERQLSQDNRLLMESFQQESKQNKRLSLHNEELQWKLKQNVEVVLTALSAAGSLHTSAINGRRSTHGSAQSLTDAESSTAGGNQLFATRTSPRPLSAGRSHNSNGSELSANPCVISRPNPGEDLEASPPASPKVKGVVEKSDSVSWVLEMDETPEALLSRLVRRAGSFRGTTPPPSSVPSPAHARTLPPPKRQRCKASSLSLSSSATTIARCNLGSQSRNTPLTSSLRSRSRSVSTDSVEGMGLDYSTWSPTSSTPLQKTCRDIRENDMVMLMNGSKNSLKRCGDDVYVSDDHEDSLQNASSAIHTLSGIGNSTMNRTSECSNDDSPSKSPGSSGSSDGSMHGGQKEHDHPCHRNRKQVSGSLTDPSATSDSLDLGDTEVLPLPPLPGSTSGDLSLLAAQPFPPMPKESAGEAMISEETSEDENDNEDEINSSSDEHSCSEDEETSSSSGSSSDMEPVGARGLVAHDEDIENDSRNRKQEEEEVGGRTIQKQDIASGQQNLASSTGSMQQYHLLLMSDSGSYSTTATTMDLSWSEDMELMPSESEG